MSETGDLKEQQPDHEKQKQQQQVQQEHKQQQQGEKTEQVKEDMKPWEQHSAVISIPRFDYNAPYSLLHHSLSGFLITCPIKREKSATKEAISILAKYIQSNSNDCSEASDADENVKRRKLGPAGGEAAVTIQSELPNCESPSVIETDSSIKQTPNLALVKVTRSGLVLFTLPKDSSLDPVLIVSRVNQSLESGALKRPLWCHRIFPIQATCKLDQKEVTSTVSRLVLKYVDDKSNKLTRPLKFAVGYSRRGIEETEMKALKNNPSDLLDRNKCFSAVAAAVKEVVPDSAVDLNSPGICILVELLPLSGVPGGSLVTAVSVLPRDLVSTKPRLCVKALVSDPKAKKEES